MLPDFQKSIACCKVPKFRPFVLLVGVVQKYQRILTLILLMRRIGWAPNNASRWQMGFNLAFKGLNTSRGTRRCPGWPMAKPDRIFFSLYNEKDRIIWTCVTVKCAPCYPRKTPVYTGNTRTCKGKKTAPWMNAMSCYTSNTKTKTCNKIVIFYCVRNATEVLLYRQCSLFSLLEPECKDLLGKFVSQRIMICGNWICCNTEKRNFQNM
jgi:hypothetical protein